MNRGRKLIQFFVLSLQWCLVNLLFKLIAVKKKISFQTMHFFSQFLYVFVLFSEETVEIKNKLLVSTYFSCAIFNN